MAKVPGDHLSVGNVLMNMSYADTFGKSLSEAYERLLLDCMRGDATLFARRDEVEEAWRFVTPILEDMGRTIARRSRPIRRGAPGRSRPTSSCERTGATLRSSNRLLK